jgi:hypothetical protein
MMKWRRHGSYFVHLAYRIPGEQGRPIGVKSQLSPRVARQTDAAIAKVQAYLMRDRGLPPSLQCIGYLVRYQHGGHKVCMDFTGRAAIVEIGYAVEALIACREEGHQFAYIEPVFGPLTRRARNE